MAGGLMGGPVDAPATPEERDRAYEAALLREREGYLARGALERLAAVDAELVRLGYEVMERATVEEPAERATSPKRRR